MVRAWGCIALTYNIALESHKGAFDEIIEEGVRLPTEVAGAYTNPRDGATKLRISLWIEGEDADPVDMAGRLGDIVLEGLPKRPAGELRLEVTLTIQFDGSLHAEAVEMKTGTTVEATLDIDSDDPLWATEGDAFESSRLGLRDGGASDG